VQQIETKPAIPAVFLPLLKLLGNPEEVPVDDVVRLVSYDGTIAAQCLRMAGSPLFGLSQPPKSIKGAVISLGLRRVQTILTCCLGQAFPTKKWALDPTVFWRHSLGCALVCQKFSEKLAAADHEKAYMAGLLHDIGFMVNCVAFSKEFGKAMEKASQEGIPLYEAELAVMGFTHCETGQAALAEKWKLADDIAEVIAHHHAVKQTLKAQSLVALVHLSDLLCRMRELGNGYYERHKVDLISDPAWSILLHEHRDLEGVDLVRFTFELDEAVEEIYFLVAAVFGGTPAPARS
jgi:putative nucleotidyltransferase with HDIG domain